MDPLITVIITAYNSSSFIIETLDSVWNQTWKEIEVIVTDDCSSDNTVELCRNWIDTHKSRFVRCELITSEYNTGVAGNANRGINAARGEWIKFIGADDMLKPNCIKDNVLFVQNYQDIRVLFSKIEVYNNYFDLLHLIKVIPGDGNSPNNIMNRDKTPDAQYRKLLVSDRIHYSPSVFLHKDTLLLIGGFDERFNSMEDYPLWLRLTKGGYRLSFMDKVTIMYRQHTSAQNNNGNDYLINPNYFKTENFRRLYTYPYLPKTLMLNQRFYWIAAQIFRYGRLNTNRGLNRFLLSILTTWLNPFRYIIYIQTLIKDSRIKEYL